MSVEFYNRHPWNLIIGLGGLVGLLVALAAVTTWWLLLVPVLAMAGTSVWRLALRAYRLRVRGYHSASLRNGRLRYEELVPGGIRSLILDLANTEPGHYELFLPSTESWPLVVPDWASSRREEIARRIADTWRRSDVHFD